MPSQTATATIVQPPAPAAIPPTAPAQRVMPQASSCTHLNDWLGAKPEAALQRLKLAAGWDSGLATGSAAAASTPQCSTCSGVSLRPMLCLSCGALSCGSASGDCHARQHAKTDHHQLAWDLRSEAVYCFECAAYGGNLLLERVAAAERLARFDYSQPAEGPPAKKRKRMNATSSVLSLDGSSALAVPARGIRNLGNSCYMSVILQTFLLNPFLRTYFLSDRHNRSLCERTQEGEPCLSCEVDYLFSEYYTTESPSMAPTRFLHAFWQCSVEAAGYAQQDAHEFLISSLNLIHSTSPSSTDNPVRRCPCIVHTTFAGQLRSKITCGRCGHQSETLEPFLDLSLDVRDRARGTNATRVEECLTSFTAAEKLPSKYDCAACGNPPEPASKRLSIKALPPVLCIQLKRFEHTSAAGSKIDSPVRFPLELDMAPFLSSTVDYPTATRPPPPQSYNLTAVVAHEGTLSQGHYTSHVRGADDFFHIDDEKVRRASIAEVLASKAYLLVYSRI